MKDVMLSELSLNQFIDKCKGKNPLGRERKNSKGDLKHASKELSV